jgi:hypothetical protein
VLPAREILAVEELDPTVGLSDKRESEEQNDCKEKDWFHTRPPEKSADKGELSAAQNNATGKQGLQVSQ